MKTSTLKKGILSSSLSISAILCIFLVWILLSNHYDNAYTFPSLVKICDSLKEILTSPSDLKAIGMTVLRVVISVCITFVIGLIMISIYVICPVMISFFQPIIKMMRSVPLAVVSIFILILAKDKNQPYFISILMTLPVVFEGLFTATSEITTSITDEMKLLKGNILIKIKDVYLPMIAPYIIMTIMQALGMSFKVLIMGEYLCYTNDSIGKNLYDLKSLGMAGVIAYGIIIVVIVSMLELVVSIMKVKVNKAKA